MNYKESIMEMDIIIVYNPRSWLHKLIYKTTNHKAGHVALYVGDGKIYEANSSGVHKKNWKKYSGDRIVYLARCPLITEYQKLKIWKYCFDNEGTRYSFLQLGLIWLQYFFKINKIPDASKKAMICSEFVANAFLDAGIKLTNKKPHETTPADILKSEVTYVEYVG